MQIQALLISSVVLRIGKKNPWSQLRNTSFPIMYFIFKILVLELDFSFNISFHCKWGME